MRLGRARIDLPPVSSVARSRMSDERVDVSAVEVPLGASEWISCRLAPPHVDETFAGELMVTLSLTGEHRFGGEHLSRSAPSQAIGVGDLFLLDPLRLHWLMPWRQPKGSEKCPRWWGLQWRVECTLPGVMAVLVDLDLATDDHPNIWALQEFVQESQRRAALVLQGAAP